MPVVQVQLALPFSPGTNGSGVSFMVHIERGSRTSVESALCDL